MGFAAALLIMAFYSEVAGWVYAYIFKAVSGEVSTVDPKVAGAAFGALVSSPLTVLAWQWVVLAMTGGIIMFGVSKGIEAVTRRLVPLLFVLLLVLCVRSLTLDGAGKGLAFLFQPDFSKITPGGGADRAGPRLLQAVARHGNHADLRQLFPRRPEHPVDGDARHARRPVGVAARRHCDFSGGVHLRLRAVGRPVAGVHDDSRRLRLDAGRRSCS